MRRTRRDLSMRIAPSVAVALVCLAAAACGKSEESAVKPPPDPVASLSYSEIPPTKTYTRKTCVIHEDKDLSTLGHPPYAIAYRGYEVQFCDKGCLKEFADDPETYVLTKVNPKAIFPK
jgi:YHS domain-containing protein